MVLDENTRTLITKNKSIKLNKNEYLLLYFLIKKRYQICYKKEIIMYIFNCKEEDTKYWNSILLVIITRLREKIKETNINIKTINGMGYILRYVLTKNEKKYIKKLEVQEKINELKNQKKIIENKIKLLEDSIK